eukprot:7391157-Prymnesium_polylepis.3
MSDRFDNAAAHIVKSRTRTRSGASSGSPSAERHNSCCGTTIHRTQRLAATEQASSIAKDSEAACIGIVAARPKRASAAAAATGGVSTWQRLACSSTSSRGASTNCSRSRLNASSSSGAASTAAASSGRRSEGARFCRDASCASRFCSVPMRSKALRTRSSFSLSAAFASSVASRFRSGCSRSSSRRRALMISSSGASRSTLRTRYGSMATTVGVPPVRVGRVLCRSRHTCRTVSARRQVRPKSKLGARRLVLADGR